MTQFDRCLHNLWFICIRKCINLKKRMSLCPASGFCIYLTDCLLKNYFSFHCKYCSMKKRMWMLKIGICINHSGVRYVYACILLFCSSLWCIDMLAMIYTLEPDHWFCPCHCWWRHCQVDGVAWANLLFLMEDVDTHVFHCWWRHCQEDGCYCQSCCWCVSCLCHWGCRWHRCWGKWMP